MLLETKLESDYRYSSGTHEKAIGFDKFTQQASFEFHKPPQVLFVKDSKTQERADFYKDLPSVILTEEEEKIRLELVLKLKQNPNFYDGNMLLITGVYYDTQVDTVYLEAKQTKYSVLVALQKNCFNSGSNLYKLNYFQTGVLVPLITRDGKTLLVQRKEYGLYSVHGGFLEPEGAEKKLNFEQNNLVTITADNEIRQEIAGIQNTEELRFNYEFPTITAVSFRKTTGTHFRAVEFIAPVSVDCHSSYLQHVFLNNLAKDAGEHTKNHELISLESQDRSLLLEKITTPINKLPGHSLYMPCVLSTCKLGNKNALMSLPRNVPFHTSIAYPLKFFMPSPKKYIFTAQEEENIDEAVRKLSTKPF